jgi:hypothetical protein
MTTTVRVAVPTGAGVRIRYGSQVAEIPTGGVHTFYLYDGAQASAVLTELGSEQTGDAPADVSETEALQAKVTCLETEVEHLKSQLEAVSNAVRDS